MVCPPFIGVLLRYLRPSSGPPPVTDCGSPAVAATATVTSLSPSPTPAARPSGGEAMYSAHQPLDQPSANSSEPPPSRSELLKANTNKLSVLPFFHTLVTIQSNFLALDSTKANHSPPRSLTRKVHTPTAAFSEASRVMHKLQQQTHTLAAKNQTLKSVIRDMQHQLTPPSKTAQNHTSVSQVPVTDKSPTALKCSKREVTAGLETTDGKRTSTGSTGQQRAPTSATHRKPAVRTAAKTPQQPSVTEAMHRGNTCAVTKCIIVMVAQTGWYSTSSLLPAPAVARLATLSQAPALNKEKTQHNPSSDRKESSNTMQPELLCWDLRRPVLTPTHSATGRLPGTPVVHSDSTTAVYNGPVPPCLP